MIRIGFSTTDGPLSWLIRTITRSPVSHCFLVVPFAGLDMVLEASDIDYRMVPLNIFRRDNRVVAMVTPVVALDDALPVAASWLGSKYDYFGLAGSVVVQAGRWFHRRWRNPAHSDDVQFCSESCVRVLQAAHHPGASSLDPEATSPADLLAFLEANGGRVVADA